MHFFFNQQFLLGLLSLWNHKEMKELWQSEERCLSSEPRNLEKKEKKKKLSQAFSECWSVCCSVVSNALWPNHIDCSLPGSSVHEFFQARILGKVAIPFSRGIFLSQGLNLGLPHCRQILYHLSHQGISFRDGAMATHSSTLAWKIPWMEEPGRLQSMGSTKSRT